MVDDIVQDSGISGSKWIAFSGSANSDSLMDAYAIRCIEKALAQGNFIMFGDSPKGVDWAILNYLVGTPKIDRMQFSVCTAVGEQPRNVARLNNGDFSSKRRFEDYQNRDFNMVEFADVTMCIWNKESKGPKATFDYAKSIQRQAYLITFEASGKPIMESSK